MQSYQTCGDLRESLATGQSTSPDTFPTFLRFRLLSRPPSPYASHFMVKAETPSSNSYSHSGSAGPSSKRKVHHESEQAQGSKKKARTRVRSVHSAHDKAFQRSRLISSPHESYSCGECHRRKQKVSSRPCACPQKYAHELSTTLAVRQAGTLFSCEPCYMLSA